MSRAKTRIVLGRIHMRSPSLTPDQEAIALDWYGYGRWEAPYWFIGIEPGGDDLDECVRMWNALCRHELIDIQGYREDGDFDYFSAEAKPQRTWQKLIWLLLAYKEQEPERRLTRFGERPPIG